MKSLRELCLAPENGNFLGPEGLQQIETALVVDDKSGMPWYLRFIVAVGAWVASWFLVGFVVALFGFMLKNREVLGVIGMVTLAVAVFAGRQKWGVFFQQCTLAVSLAGQALIYFGWLPNDVTVGTAAILSIVLAVGLYFLYPDFLSRLITCFVALQLSLWAIYDIHHGNPFWGQRAADPELFAFLALYWALHLVMIGWCFLFVHRSNTLAPLGYALVASLMVWTIESLYNVFHFSMVSGAGATVLLSSLRIGMTALAIFLVAAWAAGGMSTVKEKPVLFAGLGLALVALTWLGLGGVLLSLFFLVLGFSLQDRVILGLGLLLLPCFLMHYYYNLQLDLLTKSSVLLGSGLVLLVLRAALVRWVFTDLKEVA